MVKKLYNKYLDKTINTIGKFVNIINNKKIKKLIMIQNKIQTNKYLISKNIPTTKIIKNKSELKEKYIVAKPYNGSRGNGIFFSKSGQQITYKYLIDGNYFFEEYEEGNNYRLVLYKNNIITAFQRICPSITGNGQDSIKTLVNNENKKRNYNNIIKLDTNLNTNYIPKKGEIIKCNNTCNYSRGGKIKTIDLKLIPQETKNLFIKLSRDLKLKIISADIIATDITKEINKQITFCVNELEYCNDWNIHYRLKDEFKNLSKHLLLKLLSNIIIIIIVILIIIILCKK